MHIKTFYPPMLLGVIGYVVVREGPEEKCPSQFPGASGDLRSKSCFVLAAV